MENKLIYEAIINVMNDIGAIKKNKKNQQQGFMFRGIDDVMNAINPSLVKHKVFVVPTVVDQIREERKTAKGGNLIYSICKIKYTFFTTDGSFVEAIVIGEGMDSGDKATNKAMAIAYKYACFQVFCIPTEEMKDPDKENHNVKPKDTASDHNVSDAISVEEVRKLLAEMVRTGVMKDTILKMFGKDSIENLSKADYESLMKKFSITPDKN